jgi:hypothetical protein
MKKLILILALSLLTFTGCNQKVNTKDIYISEYNNLMKAVDDLNLYKDVKEVTKEYPEILDDIYYKNYENIYYITDTKTSSEDLEIKSESVDNINSLVNKYFVRIIIDSDENIIIFQTISEIGCE